MKLWVDDERPAPEGFTQAWSSDEAVLHLLARWPEITEVSLDHDLGGEDTGFLVLNWMISENIWPSVLTIHTSNPPARKRMLAAANAEAPDWVQIFVITDHLA